MGQPVTSYVVTLIFTKYLKANLANWNILVAKGKENKCDSLSSGERKENSLNQLVLLVGVEGEFIKSEKNYW